MECEDCGAKFGVQQKNGEALCRACAHDHAVDEADTEGAAVARAAEQAEQADLYERGLVAC